jgi:hypothetical protein
MNFDSLWSGAVVAAHWVKPGASQSAIQYVTSMERTTSQGAVKAALIGDPILEETAWEMFSS